MAIEIGILTGGLVCMALLVVVLTWNVLRRNQRPPDQALVSMVQDLVNRLLTMKAQQGRSTWHTTTTVRPMTDEEREAALSDGDEDDAEQAEPEDAADPAMQVNHMGPVGS